MEPPQLTVKLPPSALSSSARADSPRSNHSCRRKGKARQEPLPSVAPLVPSGLELLATCITTKASPLVPPGIEHPGGTSGGGSALFPLVGIEHPATRKKTDPPPLEPPGIVHPSKRKMIEAPSGSDVRGKGKMKGADAASRKKGESSTSGLVSEKKTDQASESASVNGKDSEPDVDPFLFSWTIDSDLKAWLDSDTVVSESSTFSSATLSSTTSVSDDDTRKVRHPRPRNAEICRRWSRGWCERGYECIYIHGDLEYDEPATFSSATISSTIFVSNDTKKVRHPRPRNSEICRRWLLGRCELEYECNYIHENLEYDEPAKPTLPTSTIQPSPISTFYTYTLHDHIKVKFSAGFAIQDITTGFESPWLYISKLPSHVNEADLTPLLSRHGSIQELRLIEHRARGVTDARVRFASTIEARNANTALNGSTQWGTVITTQLPVSVSTGRAAMIHDTAVRIEWEAPSIVGFAGYSSADRANKALDIARAQYRETFISAVMHVGLPAVDRYTVRFMNLPLKTEEKHMVRYAKPDGMMWNKPNYTSVEGVVKNLKYILACNRVDLLSFDVLPPPYRDGRVRAWAYFPTPAQARAASTLLHQRKPTCTGRTRVVAIHVQTLSYAIPLEEYKKIEADIFEFKRQLWANGRRSTTLGITVTAKLSAEDLRELGQLKAEFEKIRGGEVVVLSRRGSKGEGEQKEVVWDGYFGSANGRGWLRQLERIHAGVVIREDVFRRRLRLFGHPEGRAAVKRRILDKYAELNAREPRFLSLSGCMMGPFMRSKLAGLKRAIGEDNVSMDLRNYRLVIMGTKNDFQLALNAVQEVRTSSNRRQLRGGGGGMKTCPVCFESAEENCSPITLVSCGHTYCKGCLKGFLQAAAENNAFFPLTCFGNEARCDTLIPLSVARQALTPEEFDAVVGAAFRSHIHSHPKEFHYCPSPDCKQVYRSAPEGNVLQCPSCLVKICGKCHVEYHEGFECPDRDGEERLFREWAEKHDVKKCPECKVPIERAEGCNHVTCTQCGTHICWVCMEKFPKGEGIYSHMRAEHGGIGVANEDWF